MFIKNKTYFSFIIIRMICGCKENNKSVQKTSYYNNGNIASIKIYGKDKITSQQILFDSLGFVEEVSQFKNGIQDGEAYYYYPNGLIKSQRTWRNNKQVGYGDDYWSNGRGDIRTLYWYNDDTIQYYKCFDRNGKMIKEAGIHPSMDDYIKLYFPEIK